VTSDDDGGGSSTLEVVAETIFGGFDETVIPMFDDTTVVDVG